MIEFLKMSVFGIVGSVIVIVITLISFLYYLYQLIAPAKWTLENNTQGE